MPRPPSPLWEYFEKEASTKRAVCCYCDLSMCGLITRMRSHLARKCPNCPEPVRAEMLAEMRELDAEPRRAKKPRTEEPQQSRSSSATPTEPSSASGQEPAPAAGQGATPTASPTVELQDKSDLDSYVAKTIFAAGLPASTVEHAAFVKLLKRLSPNYDPPSVFRLTTAVLDLEYSHEQMRLRAEARASAAVNIGVETWTQEKKTLLVTCVMSAPGPAVFGVESMGAKALTPELLVGKIEHVMAQLDKSRVSVVVADTDESTKQAPMALQSKYPSVTFLPSCARITTAMMTDMLAQPEIAKTLDTCKQLARFFAQDQRARSALERVSEQTQLTDDAAPMGAPNDASPSTVLECLITIERNRQSLYTLLAENDALSNLSAPAKQQIVSQAFWDEMATLTGVFAPFLEILKLLESDGPLLSTFYHRFSQLWGHLEKSGRCADKLQDILSRCWHGIQHPATYTAYLLDPRFPPSSLSGEATTEALAYMKRTSSPGAYRGIVDELTRFTARSGMFADDTIWESAQKCSPIDWWKGFIGSSCPHLQAVALRVLGFPVSSGLSKRKRETFDKIRAMHAKHMSDEQASKAAMLYLNANASSGVEKAAATETRV